MNDDTRVTIQHNNDTPVETTIGAIERAAKRLAKVPYTGEDYTRSEFDHSLPTDRETSRRSGEPRPHIEGVSLASALAYALLACPQKDDNNMLNYVTVHHDLVYNRLEVSATDTHRWHIAYAPVPKDMDHLHTFRWPREDAQRFCGLIKSGISAGISGENTVVRPVSTQEIWEIEYGAKSPITVDLWAQLVDEHRSPPKFQFGAGAGLSAMHDAKHVGAAMSLWGRKGVRVARDQVDAGGRRHISLGDEFGNELARAIIVQLGFTEGEPETPQAEIEGTLHAKGAVRAKAAPKPAKKPVKKAAKKKR